jgi:hypothetical protein
VFGHVISPFSGMHTQPERGGIAMGVPALRLGKRPAARRIETNRFNQVKRFVS